MKFPVTEPLRRNGKTHKPPAEVELDVEQDAEEIDRLARKGVIRDVRETSEDDAQEKADQEAKAKAEEEAKAKADQEAKPKAASKSTTKAKG
jgi:colicin import membrane protein